MLTYYKTKKGQEAECATKCKADQNKNCTYDCLLESAGVYIDGKFIDSKIIEAFENSLNESMSKEREMFKPVFEASLEKCKILSIISFSFKFQVFNSINRFSKSCTPNIIKFSARP